MSYRNNVNRKLRDISESLGKLPPQALELEESVLGSLMLETKSIIQVIDFLLPDHFYSEQHKEIYSAIIDLHNEKKVPDMRSVMNILRVKGKIELVGGVVYIAELTSKVSSSASIEYHARVVMEMAMKREMIQIASAIHYNAYEDTTDIFELLEKTEDDLTRVRNQGEGISVKSQIQPDLDNIRLQYLNGEIAGTTSYVSDNFDKIFRWTSATISGWYGWGGDGKSLCYEYLAVLRAIKDGTIFCVAKPEDLNAGKNAISADNLYRKLAWTYLGKCTFSKRAKEMKWPLATQEEIDGAIEWVKNHFIIINIDSIKINALLEAFRHQLKRNPKIKVFAVDPWTAYEMEDRGRGDYTLRYSLTQCKLFTLKTDTRMDIITHPKSMNDVRIKKGGAFKVVDQFMINGGGAWDYACDQQFSLHAPERHLNLPNDVIRHFWNLKQKEAEIVGCNRGVYEGMKLDVKSRRYLFDGKDPISGTVFGDPKTGVLQFQKKAEEMPF